MNDFSDATNIDNKLMLQSVKNLARFTESMIMPIQLALVSGGRATMRFNR
ncbi:MAG TPA: hypothetical protein VK141_07250 [Nitrosomonas sp.]|nr:hypothetical protein [Nitrosomonas sp.]